MQNLYNVPDDSVQEINGDTYSMQVDMLPIQNFQIN